MATDTVPAPRLSQENLVEAFQQLVLLAKTTRSNGWQFKAKYYQQVGDLVANLTPEAYQSMTETAEFVVYFQSQGMKFKGELEYYLRHGTWKSRVLDKLETLLTTGNLQQLAQDNPEVWAEVAAVRDLTRIPELGEAKAKALYAQGIHSVAQLEAHPQVDQVINRKQLIGLRHYQDLAQRIPRAEMDQWNQLLTEIVACQADSLGLTDVRASMVGSYRRGVADSGDVDFYVCANEQQTLMNAIVDTLVSLEMVQPEDIISGGVKKTMMIGRLDANHPARHLDIFVFPPPQFPFALMYATGSKDFNLAVRNYALQHGWSLSDQALRQGSPSGPVPTPEELVDRLGQTEITSEQDIFDFLGIAWVEPEERDGAAVQPV